MRQAHCYSLPFPPASQLLTSHDLPYPRRFITPASAGCSIELPRRRHERAASHGCFCTPRPEIRTLSCSTGEEGSSFFGKTFRADTRGDCLPKVSDFFARKNGDVSKHLYAGKNPIYCPCARERFPDMHPRTNSREACAHMKIRRVATFVCASLTNKCLRELAAHTKTCERTCFVCASMTNNRVREAEAHTKTRVGACFVCASMTNNRSGTAGAHTKPREGATFVCASMTNNRVSLHLLGNHYSGGVLLTNFPPLVLKILVKRGECYARLKKDSKTIVYWNKKGPSLNRDSPLFMYSSYC